MQKAKQSRTFSFTLTLTLTLLFTWHFLPIQTLPFVCLIIVLRFLCDSFRVSCVMWLQWKTVYSSKMTSVTWLECHKLSQFLQIFIRILQMNVLFVDYTYACELFSIYSVFVAPYLSHCYHGFSLFFLFDAALFSGKISSNLMFNAKCTAAN